MYAIMSKIQMNETYHNKYLNELRQLYNRSDHDSFVCTLIKVIKTALVAEEVNDFASNTLAFCAKFTTSFGSEDSNKLLTDVFHWLLTTISNSPYLRLRLCQFVNILLNALGQEGTLDDFICDNIMEYMVNRLLDVAPSVRVQAVLAMQRLQVPDNPNDPVLRSYQYHLCSDPSPRVRLAVITCMGRNYHTIPYILDRLWDIDEKVRRHTYLHMSSYPARAYKVAQRLTLLEQGLNDRSAFVRKVVINVMLQQWIESYQRDLVALIGALKLDSSSVELDRFRKTSKQALKEIFQSYQDKSNLVSSLNIGNDGEYYRCVPFDKLTIEMALYWQCLVEHLQLESVDTLDQVLPELSIYCTYIEKYCKMKQTGMDKFETIEFQYILLSLIEILFNFDLSDEIGRKHLKQLLDYLLRNTNTNEKVIEMIIKCAENLLTDQTVRHQFLLDIIYDICGLNGKQKHLVHDRNLINELLSDSTDSALNLKLSELKVKILDLEEQEINLLRKKDNSRIQEIIEAKNVATEEFSNLLQPLLQKRNERCNEDAQPQFINIVNSESILKGLQITFFMIASKNVQSLTPTTCHLYNDFIFRYIASNKILLRHWALKCGAAISMHYESLAKEVFNELYAQFFRNHNTRIWETAITCIFELIDRYGMQIFTISDENKEKKSSMRQLYNTLSFIDAADNEDEQNNTSLDQGVGAMYIMSHFLDTCDDSSIIRCIIKGFSRLILHGHINDTDILEKLLLRYFDPSTAPEVNQILGIFLQNFMEQNRQPILQTCFMTIINSVLTAPCDSPLHDIRPDTITRFLIDATRTQSLANNIDSGHNKLAYIFLQEMLDNSTNKELCRLLSKELLKLDVNLVDNYQAKEDIKQLTQKLLKIKLDSGTIKKIVDFNRIIDGVYHPLPRQNGDDIDTDDDDDTEGYGDVDIDIDGDVDGNSNGNDEGDVDADNVRKNKANTRKSPGPTEVSTITNATSEEQQDNNNSCLEQGNALNNCASNVSPPIVRLPNTFGLKNSTKHRYLRRSLNSSQNDSVLLENEIINGSADTSKIRIEARIDSDKGATPTQAPSKAGVVTRSQQQQVIENMNSKELEKDVEVESEILDTVTFKKPIQKTSLLSKSGVVTRRQQQQFIENQNHNERENENTNVASKILDLGNDSNQATSIANIDNELSENISKVTQVENRSLRNRSSVNSLNLDDNKVNDECTEEAIPPSPEAPTSSTSGEVFCVTRSRRLRSQSEQRTSKLMDEQTPVRNGRKRVLRPRRKSSATVDNIVNSPARKKFICLLQLTIVGIINKTLSSKRKISHIPVRTTNKSTTLISKAVPNKTKSKLSANKRDESSNSNKLKRRIVNTDNTQNKHIPLTVHTNRKCHSTRSVSSIIRQSMIPKHTSRIPIVRLKSLKNTLISGNNDIKKNVEKRNPDNQDNSTLSKETRILVRHALRQKKQGHT